MTKMTTSNKKNDAIVRSVEKKYGVCLRYKSDKEMHQTLKKEGMPSLSKLLKLIHQ